VFDHLLLNSWHTDVEELKIIMGHADHGREDDAHLDALPAQPRPVQLPRRVLCVPRVVHQDKCEACITRYDIRCLM
jgi:hypothetical protein